MKTCILLIVVFFFGCCVVANATDDIVVAASLTFTAPSGATTVNIVDGPIVSGVQTTQINDGGTSIFPAYNFGNKTSVTVNAGTGINTVNVNNPNKAAGLTNLTVDTGGQNRELINAGAVNIPGVLTLISADGSIHINSGAGVTAPGGIRMTAGFSISLAGPVSSPSGSVGMSAGGAITQASGAAISTSNLLLLGGGSATLTDPANSVVALSGDMTGAISYTNAVQLSILSISLGGFGSATGVNTTNAPIVVNTINGGLDVNQPVDAGTSTVALTSGSSAGQDQTLNVNNPITGTGGVTLSGDHMNLTNASAAVNAGTNIATLRPFDISTAISLAGSGGPGIMFLIDAELDKVTANVLRVGDIADTGGLTVSGAITKGSNYLFLSLLNGGNVTEAGAGSLTQNGLAVQGSGVNLSSASNAIAGVAGKATGNFVTAFVLTNSVFLTIGNVDTFAGLSATLGGVSVTNAATISMGNVSALQAVTAGTNGSVDLFATGATSDVVCAVDGDAITSPGGIIIVEAGRDILLGTGGISFDNDVRASNGVSLYAGRDVTISGFADVASDDFGHSTGGDVVVSAGRNISVTGADASIGANGTANGAVTLLTTGSGQVTVSANGQGAIFSNSGNVAIVADRVVIDPASGISAVSGTVAIQPQSNPWNINVGSSGNAAVSTLEVSDAELDRVFAQTLQIGDIGNTGGIAVSATISGSTYTTLVLRNNGTVAGPGSLTVPNLSFIDGGSGGRIYNVNGNTSTFQKSIGALIPFAASSLSVTAGTGSDSFNVKASPTTTIVIDGSNPAVAPGDTLNYDAEGRVVSGSASTPAGSLTSPNVHPVNYQRIETVNVSNFVPSIFINNVTVNEGNSGTTDAVFTVSLVAPSTSTVTVDFFTSDNTATVGSDYLARNGTRSFAPGEVSKTITVPVVGDTTPETNETFFVNLSDPSNGVIANTQGVGTITNDDGPIPSPTPTATATATATVPPSPAPTATATATPAVGLVGNVSTRLPVGTGNNVLIEGFIVQGPAGSAKKIIVRAIGPSLLPFGIADAIGNPTLEIRDANNALIASNDNWRSTQLGGIISSDQSAEIEGSGLAPGNDLESAIIANLVPGSYTAIVRGVADTEGTGVVDAYDMSAASSARLANIATRGLIQPGDKLMIAGFIIQNGPVTAVILATGPSLIPFGITNALPDTTLQLRDQNGAIVREDDDWQSDQKAELEATGLQPSDPKEAAMIVTIPPGQYTAQVRGKPEATGIGVVQVYFLQ